MTTHEKICEESKALSADEQRRVLKFIEQFRGGTQNESHSDQDMNSQKEPKPCPHCKSKNVVKDGFKRGKQRFLCHDCGRTFVTTTGTVMENSHFDEAAWKTAVEDTLAENVSLDKTGAKINASHSTSFNMRHKILLVLNSLKTADPVKISGISELDETYVLECEKGRKFAEDAPRKPRKHGAKASKPGISDEQICIMAGVERGGEAYAATVNRAHPSKDEIKEVFRGHIMPGSVAFTDGLKGYKCLENEVDCVVERVPAEEQKRTGTMNLNNVNGFHSHIQEAYRHYRGVATKYLNRYNALFETVYKAKNSISELTDMILSHLQPDGSYTSTSVQNYGLLEI